MGAHLGAGGEIASGLQHHDRLLLRHPFGDFGKARQILQILAVLRDDLGGIICSRRWQIVLVDIGLVAETDDGETPILAEREPMIAMPMPPDCDDSAAEPLTS